MEVGSLDDDLIKTALWLYTQNIWCQSKDHGLLGDLLGFPADDALNRRM